MTAMEISSNPSDAPAPPALLPEDGERNAVFSSLVTADTDVVGLVAYSIYKQNKHDWLAAFRRQRGREPDANEHAAYILGEGTARRLATYRHLAEATIEGRGPEVSFAQGSDGPRPRAHRLAAPTRPGVSRFVWVGLAVVTLILVLLAARFGLPGITPPRP
ncbi:MAG: uncharacterized protein JWM36_3586 [Hyphomicrobiales bacterium]|nr:uncharacterized protein [Hyphomicrobiales bacterium]